MIEAIQRFFENNFSSPALGTILISCLPLIELKGGIPFGMFVYKLDKWVALLYGLLGTAGMTVLYLLFLIPVINLLKKTKVFKRFATWLEGIFKKRERKMSDKTAKKLEGMPADEVLVCSSCGIENADRKEVCACGQVFDVIQKQNAERQKRHLWYKTVAVFTLVAVPIPGTGVLTGSAVAAFSKMKFWRSFIVITLGNIVAGIIVMFISGLF